jgi:hypothetical protein
MGVATGILMAVADKMDPKYGSGQFTRLYHALMRDTSAYLGAVRPGVARLAATVDAKSADAIFEDAMLHSPTNIVSSGMTSFAGDYASAFISAVATKLSSNEKATDARELLTKLQNKNHWTLEPLATLAGDPNVRAIVSAELLKTLQSAMPYIIQPDADADLDAATRLSGILDMAGLDISSAWTGSLCGMSIKLNSIKEIERVGKVVGGTRSVAPRCGSEILERGLSLASTGKDSPIPVPGLGSVASQLDENRVKALTVKGLHLLSTVNSPEQFGQVLAIIAALPRGQVNEVLTESKVDIVVMLNRQPLRGADANLTELRPGIDLLTPRQAATIYFTLAGFLKGDPNRLYFNKGSAGLISVVAPKLPPDRAADGMMALTEIIPYTRESLMGGLEELSAAARLLIDRLKEGDVEKCYTTSLALVKELPDTQQISALVPVVENLGARLPVGSTRSAFEQLWAEIEKASTPFPTEEVPGSASEMVPPPEGFRSPTEIQRLGYLTRIMTGVLSRTSDGDAEQALNKFGPTILNWPEVPCGLLPAVTRASTLAEVLRILKSPTCNPGGRAVTIGAIAKLKGETTQQSWAVLRSVEQ